MITVTEPVDRSNTKTRLRALLDERTAVARQVSAVMTLDRPSLETWMARALRETVRHACANSPFYADMIPQNLAGAVAADRDGAFEALPFTTRAMLTEAYPLGLLAVPFRDVIRVDESSGTSTGQSIAAYFTLEDWVTNNWIVASMLAPAVKEEVVAIAVPYELAGIGQDLDRAFELLGCAVVPLGAGSPQCSPERMVRALQKSGATTLVCSGTRAINLGEIARRSGIDPRNDLAVNKILMAGEGSSPAKVRRLEDLWGATSYSMFGMTETNTLAMFCMSQELHLVETRTFFEVIDPESGVRVADGATGELALTTLASRAMPLVRYRTGDMCQIESDPCSCGSPLRRLRHRGRMGDRIPLGQGWASQLEIEDVVLGAMTESPYYFTFDVDDEGLEIALPPSSLDSSAVTTAMSEAVRRRLNVSVRFVGLDVEAFESTMRASAKPTMQNFRAHKSGG
jgi:phenylacetate-CoA ligase